MSLIADYGLRRLLLRITLRDVDPPVWRRVAVAEDLTLAQLHRVIQRAFGWQDCHLHEFEIAGHRFGRPDFGGGFPDSAPRVVDERKVVLGDILGARRSFRYWYDFGDDWWHDVVVEGREPAAQDAPRATLLAGENACPPEDCGGPPGYAELLAVLGDPKHPEHTETREWAGDFDPRRFDLGAATRRVAAVVRTRNVRGSSAGKTGA